MKRIWIKKLKSFKEAEKFDQNYYSKMTPAERLDILQFLREIYSKIKGEKYAVGTRLRRVIKVIQQA